MPDDDNKSPRDAAKAPTLLAQQPQNDTTPATESTTKPARKEIVYRPTTMTLGHVLDTVIAELATVPELYQQDGSLVTVDPASAAVRAVNKTQLAEMVSKVCEIWIPRGQKLVLPPVPPPYVMNGILERREFPGMRELRAVLPHPMILSDGSLLIEPGYHDGLYLPHHGLDLQVKDQPSRADAERALRMILDVVCDFPFCKRMHVATWLSILLTAVTSAAHSGNIPLTVIDADLLGTGKTKLVHIISYILIDKEAEYVVWEKGNQLKNLIFAAAKGGKRLWLIDDVDAEIRGAALNAVLTSRRPSDRIMHTQDMQTAAPHNLQPVVTGNHIAVGSDMTRRAIGIRLKSVIENPQLRTGFKHANVVAYTREHRAELLGAALTIVRAYHCAGRPPVKVTPLGSFEEWSDLVCAPLVWLGMPSPIRTQEEFSRGATSDAAKRETVIESWRAVVGEDPITVADLRDALRARAGEGKYRTLRDALKNFGIDVDNAVKLGVQLAKFKNRKTDNGWTLGPVGSKSSGGGVRWGLIKTVPAKGGE